MPQIEIVDGKAWWVTRGKRAGKTSAREERRELYSDDPVIVRQWQEQAAHFASPVASQAPQTVAARLREQGKGYQLALLNDLQGCIQDPPAPKCGVYFLFLGARLVYVGQSVNIDARLVSHVTSTTRRPWTGWTWLPCPATALAALERAYIDAYKPEYNTDPATMAMKQPPDLA